MVNKKKKLKEIIQPIKIKNNNLEELLKDVLISMTDKCLYFPCVKNRDQIEYPGFSWWRFPIGRGENKSMTNTLYLPLVDKTYKEIAENLYEALTETKVDLFNLSNQDRKILYSVITENPSYNFIRNRDKCNWEQKLD